MANNQDARPFVDLQKDAEEFQAKFEEDIEKCKSTFDTKITELICDPDSLGNLLGLKQNALIEFSKAKYDIYISMKSLMNDMEREWLKYISEMKKLFIDNVEVFLANTKLEVKLPSSEFQSSPGPRKSLCSKKSSDTTSSVYPIISSITKSIPDLNSSWSSSKSRKSPKLGNTSIDLNKSWSFSWQKNKLDEEVRFGSSPHFLSMNKEISDDDDEEEEKQSFSHDNVKGSKTQYLNENIKQNSFQGISPKNVSSFKNQEETSEFESGLMLVSSGKSIRSSTRSKSAAITKKNSNNTSNESEETNETETNNNMSSNRPRRMLAPKRQANAKTLELGEIVSDPVCEEKCNITTVISGTRRGRPAATKKIKKIAALEPDEKVAEAVTEEKLNGTSVISGTRKGRSATIKKAENVSDDTSVISGPRKGRSAATKNAENVSDKMPGRSDARETVSETFMETDIYVPAARPSKSAVRRKTVLPSLDEDISDIYTPAASRSKSAGRRKTLLPSVDEDISDIYTPAASRSKSAGRRKTLLPSVDDDISESDIIPGYHTSARSKRKTISGVSDLSSVAPSKRLKSSNTQKNKAAAKCDEGATVDDNLLEINDSYSEWITLKSIDGKIPTSPAIYEVKVWRAKKSAYIGCCDNLRQMLTLHKLQQNSGHKHLDKFIERNYNDVQIRYEVVSSINEARDEVKNKINNFVALHKTTPAYN